VKHPPALLVHGIWDSSSRLAPLRTGLMLRGVRRVHAIDLVPNDGRAPIPELGALVAREVESLRRETGAERVDIVGFSMGALVSRWFVQRGGGKAQVRRFVSISGPHGGTMTAYALPFAGARDMRPGSTLLRDLDADPNPFGQVEVHCLHTPFDLMILPPKSSVLKHARSSRAFSVGLHRWMIEDPRVLDHVAGVLTGLAE
jgi:triacylglycerol lipase